MTAMPAEHFGLRDRGRLEAGRAADVVVLDLDRLEDGSTLDDPVQLRARRRPRARQRHAGRRRRRAHRRAARASTCRGDDRPALRHLRRADGRDVGGDALGAARLGDLRRGRERQRARAPRRGAARQGGRGARADVLAREPRRAARADRAGRPRARRRRRRTSSSNEGDWLDARSRGSRSASRRPSICIENTHTRRGGTVLTRRADGGARGAGPALAPRRRAARERGGRARRAARGARGAGRHGRAQPQQGALRAGGDDPRRRRGDDRRRARAPEAPRRRDRCTRRASSRPRGSSPST